jgi:hypothetical protein
MQAPVSIRETERVIRVYHYNTVGLLIDRCLDYHLIPFFPIVVEPIQTGHLYISVERKGKPPKHDPFGGTICFTIQI